VAGRDGRIGDLLHADSLDGTADGTATDALLTESHAAYPAGTDVHDGRPLVEDIVLGGLASTLGWCGARLLDLAWTDFPAGIIAE
jgi:hypothetical protein